MAGKDKAVASGKDLQNGVIEIGRGLGLEVEAEVAVGRRIWG